MYVENFHKKYIYIPRYGNIDRLTPTKFLFYNEISLRYLGSFPSILTDNAYKDTIAQMLGLIM